MNILGWLFRRSADNSAPTTRAVEAADIARVAIRGRKSTDDGDINFVKNSLKTLKPLSSVQVWRDYNLDDRTLDTLPVNMIIDLLIDVQPDIARGVWDFLRMTNPDWTLKVYDLDAEFDQVEAGTAEREENTEAKEYLNAFIRTLRDLYGDPNIVFNKIILGGFLRGGFFAEIVLGPKGEPVDLVTPDPSTLEWRQVPDDVRGPIWKYGQRQLGGFVVLSDFPTVQYVPIDALPGVPNGRAPIHPALFPSLFLIALLRDLKRVVAQQGYPRLDLEIVLDKIISNFGQEFEEDPDKMKDIVDKVITEVKSVYESLQPDDAYIHTDVIKVNKPVGTVDSSSLAAIDKLVMLLERMMVRALKTMPLMMGVAEGTSEANANRQWEIYAESIKSIQKSVQNLLESLFAVALQAAGLQGVVEFRFSILRAAEELRDAQTEKLLIENAKSKYNAGWITQNEASIEVTGHKAVEEKPLMLNEGMNGEGNGAANPMDVQPEPGENRFVTSFARSVVTLAALMTLPAGEPTTNEVQDAKEFWRLNAPTEAQNLIDAELEE